MSDTIVSLDSGEALFNTFSEAWFAAVVAGFELERMRDVLDILRPAKRCFSPVQMAGKPVIRYTPDPEKRAAEISEFRRHIMYQSRVYRRANGDLIAVILASGNRTQGKFGDEYRYAYYATQTEKGLKFTAVADIWNEYAHEGEAGSKKKHQIAGVDWVHSYGEFIPKLGELVEVRLHTAPSSHLSTPFHITD